MNPPVSTTPWLRRHLRSDQFVHVRRPRRLRLRADCGTLWVTVDGEPDDIQIDAGQSRDFHGTAPITVGTLGGDAIFSSMLLAPRSLRLGWPTWSTWLARLVRPMRAVLP